METVKGRKYDVSTKEKNYIKAFTTPGTDTYGLPIPSARKAGYAEKNLELSAHRLMKNEKVLVAIDEVYAKRMDSSPTNIARIMSNLDNTESIALKAKSMPTLTKVTELRGKWLDAWNSNAPPDAEKEAEFAARMSEEDKKIALLIARCRTEAEARAGLDGECSQESLGKLTDALFPRKSVISN